MKSACVGVLSIIDQRCCCKMALSCRSSDYHGSIVEDVTLCSLVNGLWRVRHRSTGRPIVTSHKIWILKIISCCMFDARAGESVDPPAAHILYEL